MKKNVEGNYLYDHSAMRVIFFATTMIAIAVLITSFLGYAIAKKGLVEKLHAKDLHFIAQSIAVKIDARLERAKETCLVLADDPLILEWVIHGEKGESLKTHAVKKIVDLAQKYDYDNAFIVSNTTYQYWAETGTVIQKMDPLEQADSWFFDALKSKQKLRVNIDYNKARKDTFVFLNTLMGDLETPQAIVGVGLSLQNFSEVLQQNKFSQDSNIWLTDDSGTIFLADNLEHNGQKLQDYLPAQVARQILQDQSQGQAVNLEYSNDQQERFDLIAEPLASTGWKLVYQIPRQDSTAILNSITANILVTGSASIVLISFIFFYVSRKIANPYQRALLLNKELEDKVAERTQELTEKNQNIMDSIDYAKRIQESSLPSQKRLQEFFREHFLIWRPRDRVGGDFYWIKQVGQNKIVALGDCTGHGVPGALMTMAVNSILNHVIVETVQDNPAAILTRLDQQLKEIIQRNSEQDKTADGLDIGVCAFGGRKLVFSGAKLDLILCRNGQLQTIKGDKRNIGHEKIDGEYHFANGFVELEDGDSFYMTTDGFLDQNGGPKNHSFGRKRFEEIIIKHQHLTLPEQKKVFEQELQHYRQEEDQRDDMAVLAFKA